jgi:hypothetical protein
MFQLSVAAAVGHLNPAIPLEQFEHCSHLHSRTMEGRAGV